MSNITETSVFTPSVYLISTDDPVQGGPGGIDNLQAEALANRTTYLKNTLEALDSTISATLASNASQLTEDLAGLSQRIQTNATGLAQEITARQAGDSSLSSQITANTTLINTTKQQLEAECMDTAFALSIILE